MDRIALDQFDPACFENLVDQPILFRSRRPDGGFVPLDLVLFRVDRLRERPPGAAVRGVPLRTRPFALLFRSPTDFSGLLHQAVELLDPRFEPAPILLTPVIPGPGVPSDMSCFYYEAVFN